MGVVKSLQDKSVKRLHILVQKNRDNCLKLQTLRQAIKNSNLEMKIQSLKNSKINLDSQVSRMESLLSREINTFKAKVFEFQTSNSNQTKLLVEQK